MTSRRSSFEKKSHFDVLPEVDLGTIVPLAIGAFGVGIYLARSWILVWVSAIALLILANYLLKRRRLVIGHDGVLISQVGKSRFISYRDLASVNRFAHVEGKRKRDGNVGRLGLVLHLKSHEHVSLPMMRNQWQRKNDLVRASERISSALGAWRAEHPRDDSDKLRRGTRSTKEWLEALQKIGRDEGHVVYRVAPVDRETLLAIAEDPVEQAHSRTAAAIALREQLTTEERVRLEVSAKTVADPQLRIALDRVIENKADDDLEAILGDLDPIEHKIR